MTANIFPLWDGSAPGALGARDEDIPTITVYPAKAGDGPRPAMLILPGGGYTHLAQHEGPGYAGWLSAHGFASFVVQYRLSADGYRWPTMLWDAARAVRWVRAHAAEYGVDPVKIGMIGSSAGGHLLASLLAHGEDGDPQAADPIDRHSARLALAVLCYALLSTDWQNPPGELQALLLGPDPTPQQVDAICPLKWVSASTPPCFLIHTAEDTRVRVMHSLAYAQALQQHGVPFELHIYEKGKHGIGLGKGQPHPWPGECIRWLNEQFAGIP